MRENFPTKLRHFVYENHRRQGFIQHVKNGFCMGGLRNARARISFVHPLQGESGASYRLIKNFACKFIRILYTILLTIVANVFTTGANRTKIGACVESQNVQFT